MKLLKQLRIFFVGCFLWLIAIAVLATGCTGIITGHEYKTSELVPAYKVIKSGIVTFMTSEQIEKAKLQKLDLYVTDTYKLVAPNELDDTNINNIKK